MVQSMLIGENDRWKIRKEIQGESYALTYSLGRVTIYLMNEAEKEYFVQQLKAAKENWGKYQQTDCWVSNGYAQVLLLREDVDFLIETLSSNAAVQ